jgi:TPR repeat protein
MDYALALAKTISSADDLKAEVFRVRPPRYLKQYALVRFTIAVRLIYGYGIEQNLAEGAKYCREAADSHATRGSDGDLLYAGLCGEGRGLDRNEKEALRYARKWLASNYSARENVGWSDSNVENAPDRRVHVAYRAALDERNWFQRD